MDNTGLTEAGKRLTLPEGEKNDGLDHEELEDGAVGTKQVPGGKVEEEEGVEGQADRDVVDDGHVEVAAGDTGGTGSVLWLGQSLWRDKRPPSRLCPASMPTPMALTKAPQSVLHEPLKKGPKWPRSRGRREGVRACAHGEGQPCASALVPGLLVGTQTWKPPAPGGSAQWPSNRDENDVEPGSAFLLNQVLSPSRLQMLTCPGGAVPWGTGCTRLGCMVLFTSPPKRKKSTREKPSPGDSSQASQGSDLLAPCLGSGHYPQAPACGLSVRVMRAEGWLLCQRWGQAGR